MRGRRSFRGIPEALHQTLPRVVVRESDVGVAQARLLEKHADGIAGVRREWEEERVAGVDADECRIDVLGKALCACSGRAGGSESNRSDGRSEPQSVTMSASHFDLL